MHSLSQPIENEPPREDTAPVQAPPLHLDEITRAIANGIPLPTVVVHPTTWHIVYANGAFEHGFALPHERAIGHSLLHLCPDPAQRQRLMHNPPTAGSMAMEVLLKTADGAQRWFQLSAQPVQTAAFLLVVLNDITPYKREVASADSLAPWSTRSAQERTLGRVVQMIRSSLNVRTIVSTSIADIAQLLRADRVLILQYLPETGVWVSVAMHPLTLSPETPSFEISDQSSPMMATLRQLRTVCVNDDALSDDTTWQQLTETMGGAWLLVPIHFDANGLDPLAESVWGCLALARKTPVWREGDIELANVVAMQLSVAIHQAELYRQLYRLNADLERKVQARTAQLQLAFDFEATLKRITDKVRDSLDEDQILQTAVQELSRVLGVRSCNASLYDTEQRISTICYEYTTATYSLKGHVVHMDAYPELYNQLLSGQAFEFCSIVPNPLRGRVAMLACPIQDDQGVLGDLWLVTQMYSTFGEQDIRLVEQVANQCAIALRQSRLYQAAQAQVRELERLNQLKDDFLSTISHELRTPMANIKMATQMLEVLLQQHGMGDEEGAFARYFQILNDECLRETNLINDLLDLSRLEADSEPLMPISLNLYVWIPHIVEPYEERARLALQHLHIDLPPGLPTLITDLADLERILAELLDNACKYTPANGTITVSARLSDRPLRSPAPSKPDAPSPPVALPDHRRAIAADSSAVHRHAATGSPYLQIRVANTGARIPPEELPYIFDKFYRLPSDDPWKFSGTGLGLALVKKLVEHLSGQIWVESTPEATQFIVALPIHTAASWG